MIEENRSKTTLTTPWGTFEYIKMQFELLNVGATFQKVMNYTFRDIIRKIIEIYEDDLTVFSKNRITLVI